MESFQTVWKVSGQSGNLPEGPESFQTDWKVSSWSRKFPDSFLTVWKVSGQCKKCLDCLETLQTVWKVCKQSGNFSDKYFIICSIVATSISCTFVRRVLALGVYVATAIYALLAQTCRKRDLRTFVAHLLQKRFTHSVRKV